MNEENDAFVAYFSKRWNQARIDSADGRPADVSEYQPHDIAPFGIAGYVDDRRMPANAAVKPNCLVPA
jgi:hypothetical protein